jgi:predicted small lipoprotein YifL
MRNTIFLLLLANAALLTSGCGQTGPLYLPEKEQAAAHQSAPNQATTSGVETPDSQDE